ncbi:MAG: hypothetical protein P0Y64_16710 [Candidatus Sphingomonas colombiensis]|nr:hypothetical protein [Sphingomonas sp.]WEK42961.1 MAG: hypothetical protein P0Y64_16710 [Sphingomonas sp.]
MNALAIFDALETPLDPEPRFPVEPPDGRRDVAELPRQTEFLRLMRLAGPSVEVRAYPNAGKRNPRQAISEGIKSGVFDIACWWNRGHAMIEFKGYSQRRAGELSANQIDFGNCLHDMGFPVACFFTPEAAVAWLADIGAPVRRVHG